MERFSRFKQIEYYHAVTLFGLKADSPRGRVTLPLGGSSKARGGYATARIAPHPNVALGSTRPPPAKPGEVT